MVKSPLCVIPLLLTLACSDSTPPQTPDLAAVGDLQSTTPDGAAADAAPSSTQLPPIGTAMELEQWLATGAYKAWACEQAAHAPRAGSGHTTNRICSNDLLSGSASGEFPVGSASVKELFSGSTIVGYAVGVRTTTGSAPAAWFWYERVNTSVYANGAGVSLCANCHSGAPRDNIFTQVRR